MRTLRPLVVGLLVGAIAFACDRSPTAAPSPSLLAARVKPSSTTGSNKNTGLVVCSQTYDSVSKVIGPDTVRWVRFQPDGLVFPPSSVDLSYGLSTGALLYTNYKGCSVSSGDAVRIAQVNDSLSILGYLQTWSKVNRNTWSQGQQWVAGELPHFSNYAIAW